MPSCRCCIWWYIILYFNLDDKKRREFLSSLSCPCCVYFPNSCHGRQGQCGKDGEASPGYASDKQGTRMVRW